MTVSKRKGCKIVNEIKRGRMDILPELTHSRRCEMCIDESTAIYRCHTCQQHICEFCYSFHTKVWSMMGHDITKV